MSTALAEFFELFQKSRKIFIPADRVTIYNDGAANGAVRNHTIDRVTEIQVFIIFQCKIGTGILAVEI